MSTSDAGPSVKRHTCPDETATVVNGRWICNCPGGPYPAPPAKSPLPAQAGGAPVTPSALESALAKLRNYESERWVTLRESEAAALLAELERLQRELKALQRRVDRQYGREAMERLLPP